MNGSEHGELPFDPDLPNEPADDAPSAALPLHLTPRALGLVAAGGMALTGARYAVGVVPDTYGWPLATLTVGAFVLGLTLEALARRGADRGLRRRLWLLLGPASGTRSPPAARSRWRSTFSCVTVVPRRPRCTR